MKEYRVKKGLRISVYIVGSLVILLYAVMTILVVSPSNEFANSNEEKLLLPPLFIFMIILMIVGIIAITKRKVVITHNAIISVHMFYVIELKFDEIKSYGTFFNPVKPIFEYLVINSLKNKQKCIQIGRIIENRSAIKSYLDLKLKEPYELKPNSVNEKEEIKTQRILPKASLIRSLKENVKRKSIKSIILYLINTSGLIVSVWILFVPFLYSFSIIAAIIIPVIALIIYRLFPGLIKIDAVGRDNHSIVAGLIIPGLALVIRMSYDFEIYDYSNLWRPSLVLSIAFVLFMILFNKEFSFRKKDSYIIISIMLLFSFFYAGSSVIFLNCYYDKHIEKVFTVNITSKKSKARHENYKVEVSPWGKRIENEEISIDSDFYYQVKVNEKVDVVLCKGKFDIPWFYLDRTR